MVANLFTTFLPRYSRERNKMIRYTLFLGLILGTAASAVAHVETNFAKPDVVDLVVYKSDEAQLALNIPAKHTKLEKCALEDCSDTPQN